MTADAVLSGHPFFAAFDASVRQLLARCSSEVSFASGDVILREGAAADRMYAITSGRVEVGLRTAAHGLQVVETLYSGEILGWSWLFPPRRWAFDAVAVKPVSAIEIRADCIAALLRDDPAAALAVYRGIGAVMAERLHAASLRLADIYGSGDDH